jgi:hypothetical protein
MELFELLKEFKKIEPAAASKETSKRAILATMPRERLGVWRTVAGVFETAIAVGLVAFFIFVIVGGQFPGSSYVAPVSPAQFSVINPETLKAEAQAVDIQIQLAKVAYTEATTTAADESTQQIVAETAPAKISPAAVPAAESTVASSTAATANTSSSTASSTNVSLDQTLEGLTQ